MRTGRRMVDIPVSILQLVGLAIVVLVNRLTCFTRARSVWEPSQPDAGPTDPVLEKLLQEMESQRDELADGTIAALYEHGGIPAVEAANWLMQKRFDDPEDPVAGAGEYEDEKICGCLREHLEHKSRVLCCGIDDEHMKVIAKIIRNYLDKSGTPPPWYDDNLIRQGEKVFEEHGMLGYTVLGCASLPTGYAAPEAARVLGFTQQLGDIDVARRRLIETSLFIMHVKNEGGLAFPHGQGIRGVQRVRLMHAGVRHLLLMPPPKGGESSSDTLFDCLLNHPWDERKLGIPIHQVVMCATILCFSYVALRSFRHLGFALSKDQERAYLHCWNVAAHVMGIRGEVLGRLNPKKESMDSAEELFTAIWRRYGARESEGGKHLTDTLLTFLEGPFRKDGGTLGRLRVRLFDLPVGLPLEHGPRMLIRYLIGKEGTTLLGIHLKLWQRFVIWMISPTLRRLPDLRKQFPRVAGWIRLPSEEVAEQIFKGFLVDSKNWPRKGRPPFKIPTRLDSSWRRRHGVEPDVP